MSSELQFEIQNFNYYCKHLKKILLRTRKTFSQINASSSFTEASKDFVVSTSELCRPSDDGSPESLVRSMSLEHSISRSICSHISPEDDIILGQMTSLPPYFIIFSIHCYSTITFINKLFNASILPNDVVNLPPIHFKHASKNRMHMSSRSFEMLGVPRDQYPEGKNSTWMDTIPSNYIKDCSKEECLVLSFPNSLLQMGLGVYVASNEVDDWFSLLGDCSQEYIPVFIYLTNKDNFSLKEIAFLKHFKTKQPTSQLFFIDIDAKTESNPAKYEYDIAYGDIRKNNGSLFTNRNNNSIEFENINQTIFDQLTLLGFLDLENKVIKKQMEPLNTKIEIEISKDQIESNVNALDTFNCLISINDREFWKSFSSYVRRVFIGHLIRTCSRMIGVHADVLNTMVEMAFHMARDAVYVPPRIRFARDKEEELYSSLMGMIVTKEDEMKNLIKNTIVSQKEELIEKASSYEFIDLKVSNTGEITSKTELKKCIRQIQEFIILNLNASIAGQLANSYDILRISYSGVLARCLLSLEQEDLEAYGNSNTSGALKDIMNAAYQVNLNVESNSSFVTNLIEKMKQLVGSILGTNVSIIDNEWKRKTAIDIIDMLNDARLSSLSKTVCAQMCERLNQSHKNFEISLKQLEQRYSGRLEKREEHRFIVKKQFAPKVARLYLESRSLQDTILYGKPKLGPIIGNGEYGVVFSCENWANRKNCAVKWLVPPDEKHWNDLAMELYYTKNVPVHDRIVTLRGTVVNYEHNGGKQPAVMFIMDKLKCDLHTAIQGKLSWPTRLQIAIDVIEGIRFLHSQGLVHRDIKLKNVLLDDNNRAKLSDLGFCKFEVMMTNSIVGTPIHMSPELVEGKYDNSVDIYAFGILFWYVCSNSIRLPVNFERCKSKEDLWNAVVKGLRPEKPKSIDGECWELMLNCWSRNSDKRPVAGEIETILRKINENVINEEKSKNGNLIIKDIIRNDSDNDLSSNDEK